ncbi:MAG: MFS transporter [Acuticoccus sp.]
MTTKTNNNATLKVFQNRTYRTLWSASLVSNFGAMIQLVGAGWLMTFLTSSQSMVALVQSSVTLPIMLMSLSAGVLADNFDRRKVMLVAQVFMALVSAVLAVLGLLGLLTPWLLLSFTFLIGCGTALHNPSWQSSINELVPREDLPSAVALNAMGMNLTRSVGPAVGGAIVAVAGAGAAFTLNAVSYLALIAALVMWRKPPVVRRLPRERFDSAFAAGLRYFSMSPNLLRTTLRGFLFGFAGVAMQALMPLIVRDQLGGGAIVFGFLLGSFGLGAVTGALMSARIRARFANETICRTGFAGFAAASVIVGLSGHVALSAPAIFFAGACWLNTLSLLNVTVQLSSPRWVLGRMLSLYMTGLFGGMASGSWVAGAISDAHGLHIAFMVSAAILVCGALWGLHAPLPEFGALNLDPLNRFNEPALRLDLKERSGPIKIMVHYDIAEEDVAEFLATMAERRRIRRRDGARNWALLRDLENPDIWIETYHVPTWTEYVRHNERRTVADADVSERLRALHRGPQPMRVQRTIERPAIRTGEELHRIDPAAHPLPPVH